MTEGDPDPMEPAFGKLLEAERIATPPPAALGRVWSRLAIGGVAGYPRSAGSKGSPWFASRAGAVAAGALVVGALGGAALHAALRKAPAEHVVYVERAAIPDAHPRAIEEPASLVSPPPVASVTPPAPARVHSAPSAPSSLAAERALLDDARRSLSAGDGARALVLADDHAHRFPRAQLGEEREALAVQALVSTGQYDAARARAARFRAASPDSLFLPAIDASLGSIP